MDGDGSGSRERRTRAYWDRWSDGYQASTGVQLSATPDAWGAWRTPEAELRLLHDVAGKDVLELGCGAGQWSVWLARQGARVSGLDLSARQLAHARRSCVAAGVEVTLVHGNAEWLPFGDAAFDVVLSDHGGMSWGDPDRTVPEVARALRPGGVLVFCVTSPLFDLCWDDRLSRPSARLQKDYFGLGAVAEGDGAVSFMLSYGEWVRRFRAHGLAIDALVEPRPAPGVVSRFWPQATEWARRWPAELIWKVRREASGQQA
ncbi:MAG: class I SAM-dependent methyltransferase [Chloroflexota bacterium]